MTRAPFNFCPPWVLAVAVLVSAAAAVRVDGGQIHRPPASTSLPADPGPALVDAGGGTGASAGVMGQGGEGRLSTFDFAVVGAFGLGLLVMAGGAVWYRWPDAADEAEDAARVRKLMNARDGEDRPWSHW